MNTFVPFPQDRGPEQIKDVIGRLFFSRGWGRTSEQARLESAWGKAVGAQWVRHSKPLGLKRGVLEVRLADAMVHQHLIMLKANLLTALQQELGPTVIDIRFRVSG
jgi:predicted nucleic acid-binding Zn ribbon protein